MGEFTSVTSDGGKCRREALTIRRIPATIAFVQKWDYVPPAMKSRPRVHRPQRGFPRLEETCQRRATDTLEPPGENRACPHVTAAKRHRAAMRKWVAPRKFVSPHADVFSSAWGVFICRGSPLRRRERAFRHPTLLEALPLATPHWGDASAQRPLHSFGPHAGYRKDTRRNCPC